MKFKCGRRPVAGCRTGRGEGTRTPDPRFWRPMLYQLSYTPAHPRCGTASNIPPRDELQGIFVDAGPDRRFCGDATSGLPDRPIAVPHRGRHPNAGGCLDRPPCPAFPGQSQESPVPAHARLRQVAVRAGILDQCSWSPSVALERRQSSRRIRHGGGNGHPCRGICGWPPRSGHCRLRLCQGARLCA